VPDYPNALNGLQFGNCGEIRRLSAAVDFSLRTVRMAVERDSNFLIVHHGMFWTGLQPLTGPALERIQLLVEHDVAVYSAHLPLDAHGTLGNAVLLARELGLESTRPFARFREISVGVAGECDVSTAELLARADAFARQHGGTARASAMDHGRASRRWAICTGAGASSDTIREARALGVDTLIVGEGPHHTAVDAPEAGLVIIYAGHYATETLGVIAAATEAAVRFGLPYNFLAAPTGF
jgi:dinuclear metal center YbgI/SA1388 family protein